MIPTPHITAKKDDFAKTVFMPGDPLRAKMIAENFLEKAVLITGVRNMLGFTGFYKGKRVSVMSSGMGMPSMGIYSYELYNFYGVENIIRMGSAGGINDGVQLRDLIIAVSASTDSNFMVQYSLPGVYAPAADFDLACKAAKIAEIKGLNYKAGNILTTDRFYDDTEKLKEWSKMNVLAVEMETAALYATAARLGKKALAILTVSDCPFKNLSLPALERQNGFTDMVELSLEAFYDL